jgi:HD-GYP domain-containing protein (c-di-GMP phosphodiesterase class II)
MIRPRSYRPAMSAEQAIEVMRTSQAGYDLKILDALQEILRTSRGDKLLDRTMECNVVCP